MIKADSNIEATDFILQQTAGEALSALDAVYISTADGKAYKCDADDVTKVGFIGFAQEAAALNASVNILHTLHVNGFAGLTVGSTYYLSGTPGAITSTAPDLAVPVGKATKATVLKVSPIDFLQRHTFTANGTWTKPSFGTFALIELWGGGGSGSAASSQNGGTGRGAAAGGGGGEFVCCLVPLALLGASYAITIGQGGAARVQSTNGSVAGLVGGTTSFGSLITAIGGAAGSLGQVTTGATAVASSTSGGTGGVTDFPLKTQVGGVGGGAQALAAASFATAGTGPLYSGGGGGGAECNGLASGLAAAGGDSTFGGDGGLGAFSNTVAATATAGSPKGGGGGAAASVGTATSGAGGRGELRVTVI